MTVTRKPLILAILLCILLSVTDSHAAIINAASCAYTHVSDAVWSASPGDTIKVPRGSCIWNNSLNITTGIYLIGAGIGNTIITAGSIPTDANRRVQPIINYAPSNYAANTPFRLSGFTLDLNNTNPGLMLGRNASKPPFIVQTKIRVDHNRFTNAANPLYQAIWVYGGMHGVVDNNTFDGIAYPSRSSPQQAGASWWDNFTMSFGAANDQLYFEDNIFTGVGGVLTDCQYSGRYLYRYNTITTNRESYPLFDMHGNSTSGGKAGAIEGMYSCFGGEIYGNQVNAASYGVNLLDQRGGKALAFYNNVTTTGDQPIIKVREEYEDMEEPTTNSQPQHVSTSYFWGNRKNLNGPLIIAYSTQQVGDIPLANREYWFQGASFDGTSGVGCGTLASRPSTCTAGVGYWATNQSCSDLTGMVGKNPSTPLSGTLYKCTAPNTWTAYYTPYPYPHPLRQGGLSNLTPPQGFKLAD